MRILVFAGTTEGRKLIEVLLKIKNMIENKLFESCENLQTDGAFQTSEDFRICVCVATEYGKNILEPQNREDIEIRKGRLKKEEMQALMTEGFSLAVDATHPYATEVTANIKDACRATGTEYIRLLRGKTAFGDDCVFVKSTKEAVEYLKATTGNVLLTVGSKELAAYREVDNFQERLYARVLPMEEVVAGCRKIGFDGKHLICMQGPFSVEMNEAMLRQLDCRYLVTKDTGKEGGAWEKYQAAQNSGVVPVVVGRAEDEEGNSLDDVIAKVADMLGICDLSGLKDIDMAESGAYADWFPMFVNLKDVNVAVAGAGKIAGRRIRTLLQFSCNMRIIAKEISEDVKAYIEARFDGCGDVQCRKTEMGMEYSQKIFSDSFSENQKYDGFRTVEILEKEFEFEDLKGANIALACTNDRELNLKIGRQCREAGILVNIADNKEECDFYFPGVVKNGYVVAGITAQGKNHALAKAASAAVRKAFDTLEK